MNYAYNRDIFTCMCVCECVIKLISFHNKNNNLKHIIFHFKSAKFDINLHYKQHLVTKSDPIKVALLVFVYEIELHDFA